MLCTGILKVWGMHVIGIPKELGVGRGTKHALLACGDRQECASWKYFSTNVNELMTAGQTLVSFTGNNQ